MKPSFDAVADPTGRTNTPCAVLCPALLRFLRCLVFKTHPWFHPFCTLHSQLCTPSASVVQPAFPLLSGNPFSAPSCSNPSWSRSHSVHTPFTLFTLFFKGGRGESRPSYLASLRVHTSSTQQAHDCAFPCLTSPPHT